MCGRYSLSTTAELVEEVFGVEAPADLAPRWNIAPSEPAPIVRAEGSARRIDVLRWGLVPEAGRGQSRTGSAARARLLINARAETVTELVTFRDSFRERRCLVPADGFYEWERSSGGSRPHHIRFSDRRLFAFAGLWERQGSREAPPAAFAVITCPPSDLVRPLHDRMPVILPADAWDEWLHGSDLAALRGLLVPWAGPELEAVPVGAHVNRAGNEGPECLAPPAPPRPPAQRSLFS